MSIIEEQRRLSAEKMHMAITAGSVSQFDTYRDDAVRIVLLDLPIPPRVWEVTEERKAALLSAADDDETAALGALTMADKERYNARADVLRAMLKEVEG